MRELSLSAITFYRIFISPFLGGACRFEPSCSCYAQKAFEVHSLRTAFYLSFKRILKCRPFSQHGYDPVPPGEESS